MTPRKIEVDLSTRLTHCPEKAAAVAWPLPIDRRLDEFVDLVEDSGERTTRKELTAAIVLSVEPDAAQLAGALRRYRTAVAVDALVAEPEGNVISMARHRPGPRRRARS